MSSFVYNHAIKLIFNGGLNLDTDTLKIMLVNSTYTPDPDHDFVDAGGGSDPLDAEIVATNYTGGWGGSGRKTVPVTVTEQDANNRSVLIFTNQTWVALGGAANDTVVGAILIKEGGANDTDSILIAYWDVVNQTTAGVDYVLSFDPTNGNLRGTSV